MFNFDNVEDLDLMVVDNFNIISQAFYHNKTLGSYQNQLGSDKLLNLKK